MSESAPTASVKSRIAGISRQRSLAVLLVIVQAAAMWMLSRAPAIPAIAVAIAVVGLWTQWRVELTRQRMIDTLALLGLVFVAKYMLLPDNPRYIDLFASQPIALVVGEYMFVVQSLAFFVSRRGGDDRLTFLLPGMGVITLACIAIVEVDSRQRELFQMACVAFGLLSALFWDATRHFQAVRPTRRVGRPIATSVCLILVGLTGWMLASSFHFYERQMDMWVRQYLMDEIGPAATTGFSNTAQIGSVSLQKSQSSNAVALRVLSSAQPDYFRGRAYSKYQQSEWRTDPVTRTIQESDLRPASITAARHIGREFAVSPAAESAAAFEVWPDRGLGRTLAAPQGTVWVQADCLDVTANQHDILQANSGSSGSPYTVHVRTERPGSSTRRPDEVLSEPPGWAAADPAIRALADRLFARCETTTDRIAAVIRYFGQYDYSLEVQVPADWDGDPVAWFLLQRPSAHCEFFASGSAVLLRMGGVPCRYVTGFVFTDQNRFSGEWIARNRDAHAWVEAWDAESGRWLTVESTPGSGVPQSVTQTDWSQFREYLASRMQQLRTRWRQEGIRLIGHLILSALLSPVGLGLFGTALVVAAFILQKRLRGRERPRPKPVDSRVESLNSVLRIVDRIVARRCRARPVGETLTAFAADLARRSTREADDPLSQAADWYRAYAAIRYSATSSATDIEPLIHSGREVARQLLRLKVPSVPDRSVATRK